MREASWELTELYRPGESIVDVCRATGISEKKGHKWLQRFGTGGPGALTDRSRA